MLELPNIFSIQSPYQTSQPADNSIQETPLIAAALLKMMQMHNQPEPEERRLLTDNYSPYQRQDYFSRMLKSRREQAPELNLYGGGKFGTGSSLMDILAQRESGSNPRSQNKLGFIGMYQFGAPALETAGVLKKGTGKLGNTALNNPANWKIPGGKEAFLSSPDIQRSAMQKLLASNERTLQRIGVLNKNTPQHLKNAYLAAAHLGGPGGAKALMRGKNPRDVFGTGVNEYFKLGLRAR